MPSFIETDSRSRVVLPGHPNQVFIVHEQEDGSIFLEPAQVVSDAQLEYDRSPELQDLLARAIASPRVYYDFQRRNE